MSVELDRASPQGGQETDEDLYHPYDHEGSPATPLFEPKESTETSFYPPTSPYAHNETPEPTNGLLDMNATIAHARSMKAAIKSSSHPSPLTGTKPAHSRRRNVEDDPENIIIKDLRQNHNMDWGAIANYLNEERLKRGEPQTMTQPAVYSRFVRNAPKVAAANGEIGFDVKDFMHLRHPHHYPNHGFRGAPMARKRKAADMNAPMSADGSDDDEKEDPKWYGQGHRTVRLKSKLATDSAELETAERTDLLVKAVGVVQRNFWVFVADELERTSGKFYDVKAIESRWKGI